MAIIEIENLTLALNGKNIIAKLNVEFWEGHVHAVVGPNGAGKSTLASTIAGLSGYTDFEGEIRYNGESLKGMNIDERARKGITLAWQEPARFEGLSIKSFIMASSRENDESLVLRVLDDVGLDAEDYMHRSVDRTLSGGERKKIELASILAMRPRVALLDEPDSGIDVESLERIFEAVDILKRDGTTVILITHSLAVLNRAEHAFLMCDGNIIDKGTIDKISKYFEDRCIPCDHKNMPNKAEIKETV
ncbi:MAG: ATP-binding cassette domain-containing protein [candidate division Zixibacteria bacterium]|nr:ATP-binding cassette domain-containing protein [candidate division Zixibacteria bacterium]